MKLLTANWDEDDCFGLFETTEFINDPSQITGKDECLILW